MYLRGSLRVGSGGIPTPLLVVVEFADCCTGGLTILGVDLEAMDRAHIAVGAFRGPFGLE